MRKVNRVSKKCLNCQNNYEVLPSKADNSKFCSKKCCGDFGKVCLICQFCDKDFIADKSVKNTKKFCSIKCLREKQQFDSRLIEKTKEMTCRQCKKTSSVDFFITSNNHKNGKQKLCQRCYFLRYYANRIDVGDIEKHVDKIIERRKLASENPTLKWCFKGKHWAEKAHFPKTGNTKDGLKAMCRECAKPILKISQKKFYSANREQRIKRSAEYAAKNAETIKLKRRTSYEQHKTIYAIRNKEYRRQNKTAVREASRKHYLNNKESYFLASRNRKARKKSAQGSYTNNQWKAKLEYFGYRCYLCGESLQDKTIHAEHRKPLIKGGTNWIANIAPSCAQCNLSKHIKTEKEYRESLTNNFK